METKELMIGDWVYNEHHKKNIQITVYDFFTHGHDKNGEQYLLQNCKPTCFRDIKPIFITDDILEKNGFIRDSAVSVRKSNKIDIVHWSVDNLVFNSCTEDGFPIHIPHLRYVHELQHALRLCGHNDLVDNFKIE